MKELGNLAIICAQHSDVVLLIRSGKVSVRVCGEPILRTGWDDDEGISRAVHELNFGRYAGKGDCDV